jgi:hypothetical protein
LATAKVAGTVQVAFAGAPLQANPAFPAKPGPGVNCNRNCAVWPAEMVAVVAPPEAGLGVNAALGLEENPAHHR